MSLAIVRRERALRLLPVFGAVAALGALILGRSLAMLVDAGIHFGPGEGRDPALDGLGYWFVLVPAVQAFAVATAFLPVRTRVHEHERALPVSMRALVLGRLAVSSAVAAAAVLASASVLALGLPAGPYRSELWSDAVGGLAVAWLALALAFAWTPTRLRLRGLETAALALAGLGLLSLAGRDELAPFRLWALAPAAALVAWIAVRVPAAVTADEVAGGRRTSAEATHPRRLPLPLLSLSPLHRALFRGAALRTTALVALPALVLLVAFFGRGSSTPVFQIWFPPWLVGLASLHGLAVLHGVGHLPLSRARVLPWAVLPSLLASVLAFSLLGALPREYRSFEVLAETVAVDRLREEVLGGESERGLHVRVPPELWALGSGEAAPEVVAPWGERFRPARHPLLPGSSVSVHNPYDVGPESTVRFLEWQVGRALRDAHGLEAPPDARWFPEHDPATLVGETSIGLREHRPWGESLPRPGAAGSAAFAALGVLVWLAGAGAALLPRTPPRTRAGWRARRAATWSGMALALSSLLALSIVAVEDRALLPVLASAAHGAADGALGSSRTAWLALDVALAAAGYLWLLRRVRRIETPPLPRTGLPRRTVAVWG